MLRCGKLRNVDIDIISFLFPLFVDADRGFLLKCFVHKAIWTIFVKKGGKYVAYRTE